MFFLIKLIKKETPARLFSCEFWETYKNKFLIEHLRWLLLDILEERAQWQKYKNLISKNIENENILCKISKGISVIKILRYTLPRKLLLAIYKTFL